MADHEDDRAPAGAMSRRTFLGASSATAALIPVIARSTAEAATAPPVLGPGAVPLRFKLNGAPKQVQAEPRETLAEVLLYRLELTGTKVACDRGGCGACMVIIDGRARNACMTPALDVEGRDITTVEGLGANALHPVQSALHRADGLQCGYCTPGFVVSACALYAKNPTASREELVDALSGNLCRCGSQPHIIEALAGLADQARRKG